MSNEKITLKFPVKIDGKETKELSMRRPKVSDMMIADKAKGSEAEKEVSLFANLCEVSPEDVGQLDMSDYKKLQEIWQGFLA